MPVVSNTVKHPDGSVAAGVRVRIRLIASTDPVGAPGFVASTDSTIISETFVLTNSAGLWSATLVANALVTPANTVYEVVEDVAGKVTAYYVTVPNAAGPYWAGDILSSSPLAIEGVTYVPPVLREPPYSQGVWDWGREWDYGVSSPTQTRPKVESAGSPVDVLGELWDFSANPNGSEFFYTTGPDIRGAVSYTPTVNGYSGVVFPAGKYIVPPAGVYMWHAYAYMSFPLGTTMGAGSPGSVQLRHLDEWWDDPVQGGPFGSVGHPLETQIDVLTISDVIAGAQEFIVTSHGFIVLADLGPAKLHHLAVTAVCQKLTTAGRVTLAGLTLIGL